MDREAKRKPARIADIHAWKQSSQGIFRKIAKNSENLEFRVFFKFLVARDIEGICVLISSQKRHVFLGNGKSGKSRNNLMPA